eukprot:COSAG01_NODE_2927_length_6839_cov_3.199407_8_plen_90_part_00
MGHASEPVGLVVVRAHCRRRRVATDAGTTITIIATIITAAAAAVVVTRGGTLERHLKADRALGSLAAEAKPLGRRGAELVKERQRLRHR